MGMLYSARRISRPGEASSSIHSSRASSEPIGPHDRSEFGLQHLESNSPWGAIHAGGANLHRSARCCGAWRDRRQDQDHQRLPGYERRAQIL